MKRVLIVFSIFFLPITIIYFVLKWIIKGIQKKRIHAFLCTVNISDIDAISGVQFEDVVAHLFTYFGYKTTLTKRTGDYGVDVFASLRNIKYCIQAKLYYNHNVGASAIQQIHTGKNYYLCDYAVVITNVKYTKQAKDMADNLNVICLERNDLANMLNAYKTNNRRFLKRLLEDKLCGIKY